MKEQKSEVAVRKSVIDYSNEFGAKFRAGIEAIRDAARIYVEALNEYPDEAKVTFMERYPGVGVLTWDVLERIGLGQYNANLMLLPYQAAVRLGRMPIALQDRIFNSGTNGFQVVSEANLQSRVLPVTAISAKAAEVLVDVEKGRVRTVEEQRRYILERRKLDSSAKTGSGLGRIAYKVVGKVVFIRGVEFDLETMKRIVSELEANAK